MPLSADTLPRPVDMSNNRDGAVLYVKSYLLIRTVVGIIGIVLPIILMFGEASFKGGVHARGSLSAYYHSPMQDVFVGSLCVVGLLLLTYMAGQPRTVDFWFSNLAGLAVLGVVFLPTTRPDLPAGAPLCGPHTLPEPPSCSPVESALGEMPTARAHAVCAAIFIVSLAVICCAFAYREHKLSLSGFWWKFHAVCAGLILLAVGWVFLGDVLKYDIVGLKSLYVGEVVSVWSFGASWFAKGDGLRTLLLRPIPSRTHGAAGAYTDTHTNVLERPVL
jgi:hypothetical protein